MFLKCWAIYILIGDKVRLFIKYMVEVLWKAYDIAH